ncbi:hypothetical protein [Corallibacter sp.]|uniref:hypothetical protein n=1 Tax=Corallibacter sp. TaxID=2038084 RepID=UPI003A8E466E
MKYVLLLFILIFSLSTFSQETISESSIKDPDEVPFAVIEKVPVYKGCNKKSSNVEIKKCFNDKINSFIASNFNTNLGRTLDIEDKSIVRINVFFKIDKTGKITQIEAKSEYPELNNEAKRVIRLIPQLESPGYVRGKPVTVPYFLPIQFQVDNPKSSANTKNDKFPTFRGCEETMPYNELKKCTLDKIADYVRVSINYELADKLFPTQKSTQFKLEFTINKKGKAENITAQAHKKAMAIEAINVLKRMPKLKKPGYKNGKAVDTSLSLFMTIYF